MEHRTCPNCGAALPELLRHARMVNCDYCGASAVLEDDVLRQAGVAGAMLDAPELIGLGRMVELDGHGLFTATGHVRYDYGRGHWDEYHGATLDGALLWVSVDEGDVAVQRPLPPGEAPRDAPFRLGAVVRALGETWTADEVENATLIAFRGQLPEPVAVDDTHLYANFSGEGGRILSGERWSGGEAWFAGAWIDPWRVRPA